MQEKEEHNIVQFVLISQFFDYKDRYKCAPWDIHISDIVIHDYNKIKHLHSVNIENKREDQNKTQLILKQQGAGFGWSKTKGNVSVSREFIYDSFIAF